MKGNMRKQLIKLVILLMSATLQKTRAQGMPEPVSDTYPSIGQPLYYLSGAKVGWPGRITKPLQWQKISVTRNTVRPEDAAPAETTNPNGTAGIPGVTQGSSYVQFKNADDSSKRNFKFIKQQ